MKLPSWLKTERDGNKWGLVVLAATCHQALSKLSQASHSQNLDRYNSLLTAAQQIDRAELKILTRHFLD